MTVQHDSTRRWDGGIGQGGTFEAHPGTASNPLQGLKDPEIRDVYSKILLERLDINILLDHYQLSVGLKPIARCCRKIDYEGHVNKIIRFLLEQADQNLYEVSDAFWSQFCYIPALRVYGRPKEVRIIDQVYHEIKPYVLDLAMIRDLLNTNVEGAIIADIGAGKNRFGTAILAYIDTMGIRLRHIIGTDINDWSIPSDDKRLSYEVHESDEEIPIEDGTVNMAIIKWALHHMSLEAQSQVLEDVQRLLRPGGQIVVIEALRGHKSELKKQLSKEMRNTETWPPGPWYKRRKSITNQYLDLSLEQQKIVLALEDCYGHLMECGRSWMPLPFNYPTISDLQDMFEEIGFCESVDLRRVFGYAPIIRYGPPSVRVVFRKSVG